MFPQKDFICRRVELRYPNRTACAPMQLVDPEETRAAAKSWSRALYAALIDSMCQNFWPMFAGAVCAAVAAVMTALKTGNELLWPCAVLIVGIGTVRAFEMRKYERRTATADVRAGPIRWSRATRSAPCVYAGVLGALVLPHHFRQRRRRRAHGLRRGDDRLHRRRRGPQLRPARSSSSITSCWPADRCRWRWRCMAISITSASPCCWCCSSSASRTSTSACTRSSSRR